VTTPVGLWLAGSQLRTSARRSRGLVLAVALGAALVVATTVLGSTMQRVVDGGAGVEYANVDLVVRSEQGVDPRVDGGRNTGTSISAADVRRISRLPGVDAASSIVRAQAALVAGDRVRGVLLETLPSDEFVWQHVADGRFPTSGDEVALSRETLDDLGLDVGDRVALGLPEVGREVFTVVGAVDVRGSLRYGAMTYGVVTVPVAQALAAVEGANEVQLRLVPGADPHRVVDDINAAVPVGWPQLTEEVVAATDQLFGTGLGVLSGLLSGFALVAAVIAAVVLSTVVSASLPGRRRDLALLRALGATRGQLRSMVALETGLLALVGGLAAVPLGVGVAAASLPLLGHLPGVPTISRDLLHVPVPVLVAVPVAALAVGVLAAVVPAWRVGRVSPASALRGDGAPPRGRGWTRGLPALTVTSSLAALVVATRAGSPALLAVAGLVLAVAWIAATPSICRVLARATVAVVRRRHPVAELAAAQLLRFPGRAASTGLAATLAATVLGLSWVTLASLSSTTEERSGVEVGPEVMVGAYAGGAALAPGTVDRLAEVDGVSDVLAVDSTVAMLTGPPTEGAGTTRVSGNVTGARAADLARLTDGRFPLQELRAGTAYLPASDLPPFATGSTVTLRGPDGRKRLRAVYVDDLPFQALVAPRALAAVGATGTAYAAWLDLEPGADRAAVLDGVRAVAITAGGQPVSGSAPAQARVDGAIGLARGLATGMLALSVLIAVVGAALTVATTVRERSAELATLRMLGMDGAGVRRLVGVETWAAGALSTLLGLVLGSVLGWAVTVTAADVLGISARVSVPYVPLLVLGLAQLVVLRVAVTGPLDRVSLISPADSLREAAVAGGTR
jgi:putative ABC transport system permease protein